MDKIQIGILEDTTLDSAAHLMCTAARLTQRGETIATLDDLRALHDRPYSERLVGALAALPHPTLQKIGTVTIGVVGASRRFLAQITRHQNEVKFMSASFQYSDYTDHASYVVPYEVMSDDAERQATYCHHCEQVIQAYEDLIADGVDHDDASYLLPQATRGTVLICATPYEWKHIIRQRVCRRNTSETRYIALQCWELLAERCEPIFGDIEECGAFCQRGACEEGRFSCGRPMERVSPGEILRRDYPLLYLDEKK